MNDFDYGMPRAILMVMQEPTPREINRYLRWLEDTDPELIALYEQARFVGIMARVLRGKAATGTRSKS